MQVLLGIEDIRRLLKQPSLFAQAIRWLKSFPKYRFAKITAQLAAQVGGEARFGGHLGVWHEAPANHTPEDRICIAESNLLILRNRVDDLQQQIDQANQERRQDLRSESDVRRLQIGELGTSLEMAETSGIHLSLIGLLWLAVGLIMSTASLELSRLFIVVPPK